jgi:acetyl-CoA C-acetyltransferase
VLACLRALEDPEFCRQELGRDEAFPPLPRERLNPDGGAVSLGHPVGTSGARIVLHLLRSLELRGAAQGIASLCIGGGQGGALWLQREGGAL